MANALVQRAATTLEAGKEPWKLWLYTNYDCNLT